ncbi:MAG: leucine-rich repeat protein [Acinetobacter sp.]
MPTYTGVADGNGDFDISFGTNTYTAAEKIIVTSEKDGATKSIELYAPSNVTGGGVILFSGTMDNFPANIGEVTLSKAIQGTVAAYSFTASTTLPSTGGLWNRATGLVIPEGIESIGDYAFAYWSRATRLVIPLSCVFIGAYAFRDFGSSLGASNGIVLALHDGISLSQRSFVSANIKKLTLPASLASIPLYCFSSALSNAEELICLRTTPPTYNTNAFQSMGASCVIKVPVGSLNAYQTASGWSAFASQMTENI